MSISPSTNSYHSYAIEDIETPLDLTAAHLQQGGRVVMGGISGAPTLVSATPADNSGAVPIGANIVLTFSGSVVATSDATVRIGDGYTQSYIDKAGHTQTRWVGSTDSHTVYLNDTSQVTIIGSTVTINLLNDLKAGVNYSVTMAAGALQDSSNRPYSGLADSTKLNFTTDTLAQVSGAIHFEDTGVSATDYITNSAAQTVHGTYSGILGANEHVQVSIDNGATWHLATASDGSWTCSGFDALTSSSTMLARVLDSNEVPRSTVSQAFVYDHTAPTIVGTPVISDTNLTAGESATVTVTFSEQVGNFSVTSTVVGSTYSAFTTSDGGLTWTANVTGNAATQNTNANDMFHVSATDLAGNLLEDDFHISHAINTAVAISSDTGSSISDFYTATAAQTLTGSYLTLPTSGSVMVSVDGGSTFNAASVDQVHHTWSLAGTLQNGTSSIVVHVLDSSQGVTESYSHSYTLDTVAAVESMAAVTVDLVSADDSLGASSTDNITNVTRPHVTVYTGNARHLHLGDEIQIVDTNHGNAIVGAYVLMESDLTPYGGDFATTLNSKDVLLNQSLSDGEHDLKVQIGDLAGNAAATPSSTALPVYIDTHAPTLTAHSTLQAGSASITLTFDEAIDASGSLFFTLSDGTNSQSLGVENLKVEVHGNTMTLTVAGIQASTSYNLVLDSGSITDLAGNAINFVDDHVASFSTGAALSGNIIASATASFDGSSGAHSGQLTSHSGTDKIQILDGSTWVDGAKSIVSGDTYNWTASTASPSNVIELRMVDATGTPVEYLNYGNSVVYFGSSGSDTIVNTDSNAIVFSGEGNDIVTVGSAAHVTTGSGNNNVVAGSDATISSNGFDGINVGSNANVQLNGNGSTVVAGTGLTLTTNNGSHSIVIDSLSTTSIAAGTGNDTLNLNFNSASFDLSSLSGTHHMSGIDIINMMGTGNTITVGALTDATALSGTTTLAIAGNTSNTVLINGSIWADTHTTSSGYEIYQGIADSSVHLLVVVGMNTTPP
jgi:hypothetical protein